MYDIAMYGLGVMGRSLARNLLDKGFAVALFSKNRAETKAFFYEANRSWKTFTGEKELISNLARPRMIFLMITAGEAVDRIIEELLPYLDKGDVLLDGGNSHYKDTTRRYHSLKEKGIRFLGVGVSGGETGALTGPSMMAGGSRTGWENCKPVLQKISAQYGNQPCCDLVGPEGAGHYVKMVHNGIEYALLQLIADLYFVMKKGLGLNHEAITETFAEWQSGPLDSYLINKTVLVLEKRDEDGEPLIDKLLDVAGHKGTGNWAAAEAIERSVYAPTICEAVFFRHYSGNLRLRTEGHQKLTASARRMRLTDYKTQLRVALQAGILCSYAQGFELIRRASDDNNWCIDLSETAALWREGCIIRSPLLEDMMEALKEDASNIIVSKKFSYITNLEPFWREVVIQAQRTALSVPTLVSTLSYYDCLHTGRISVNLVQALRDCFGAHTYERLDRDGRFHTNWD